jgi:Tol biopolymer transport system component/subtilisin-like proprotein convertase family protein
MRFSATDLSPRKIICLLLASTLILTPLCNYRTHTVKAFMPGAISGHIGGFGNWTHQDITESAIWSLFTEFGFTSTSQLNRDALDNITKNNGDTDKDDEKKHAYPHFDGEQFFTSQERLKVYKQRIDERMSFFPSGQQLYESQYYLGRALHTLQDFYSHSNWVELDPSPPIEINHGLGDFGITLSNPAANIRTCAECTRNICTQCENTLITQFLTTGYYGDDIETKDKKPPGKCSHGGNVLGVADTSGKGLIHAGINKDTRDCVISPHNEKHLLAAGAAIEATKEYLKEVRDLIGNPNMRILLGGFPRIGFVVDTTGSMGGEIASVQQQILSFVQTRASLNIPTMYFLFPFNDPGFGTITMTSDPNAFTTAVNALSANGGGDCPEPVNSALLRAFGQFDMGSGGDLLLFTDAAPKDPSLTLAVGSFARSAGIRLTTVFSGQNSGCDFTDSRFSTMTLDTGGQFWSLLPSEVGLLSNFSDFLALPNQVDVFSRIGFRSTVDQIFTMPIDAFMPRLILGVTGTGATNIVVRRPDNTIVQPNDPNISRVALSTGVIYSILNPAVGNWSITITGTGLGENHPYTSPVAYEASLEYATARDTEDNQSGPSAKLEPTAVAETSAALQSPEQFSIRVAGESTIDVSSFEFLEPIEDAPHPAFRTLTGSPIAGKTIPATAKLVADGSNTANVQFRALDGTVLQTLSLQEIPWPGDDPELLIPRETHFKEYIDDITVPNVPFQVYVTGLDNNGNPYQRLVPGIVRPQTVEIISPPVPNLHPGQSIAYNIQVKNSGPADTYVLSAVDDLNFLTGVAPTNFTLNTNETKIVKVVLDVPANAVPFSLDHLRFTVEGANSSTSASVGPFVVSELPALRLGSFTVTPIGGDGDAFLDPGEGATLSVQLVNNGASTATGIHASLSTSTSGVVVSQPSSDYSNIAPSANGTNLTPFVFYLPPNIGCGQTIQLTLSTSSEGNGSASQGEDNFTVSIGQPTFGSATVSYTGSAVSIPDSDAAGVNVPLTVSGVTGQIEDINFRIDGTTCNSTTTVGINHTYVSDLSATLISAAGTGRNMFELITNGFGGENFCQTVLDDQATTSIQDLVSTDAPFTGTFKPNKSLSIYRGENPNGTWNLHVSDTVAFDEGSVRAFSLIFSTAQYSCSAAPADTTAPSCTPTDFRPGPPASADITTQDLGTGLAAIRVTVADNVNVVVPSFTPGTTTPIVVSGTLIDPNVEGVFEIESVDVAGNRSTCERVIPAAPPKILFRTNRDGNYQLYVMNQDGTSPTRLTDPTLYHQSFSWSPNGQKIAFSVDVVGSNSWDIFVMDANGSNRVNITHDIKYQDTFGWSPDSTKLAFETDRDGPYALWWMNIDGTGLTRLTNTGGAERAPAWSPNGQKIAFLSYINSVNSKLDIWSINPDATGLVNLTQSSQSESAPIWKPDGSKILFGRRSSNTVPYDLYIMNPDGSGLQFLGVGATLPGYVWSADGSKILFTSSRDGNFEIYMMNADGSNQVRLTNNSAWDSNAEWAADGQHIIFHSFRTGNWEVYVMNADGSNVVNLTNNSAFDGPGLSQP